MGKIEKRLPKKVMDVLENCGWRLNSIEKQDGEYCAEIENCSPAGEDLVETIWYNGTANGFIDAVDCWCADFDVDEHVELWIDKRGKNGVPGTVRELVEDAEAIEQMFVELSCELDKLWKIKKG